MRRRGNGVRRRGNRVHRREREYFGATVLWGHRRVVVVGGGRCTLEEMGCGEEEMGYIEERVYFGATVHYCITFEGEPQRKMP